MKSVIDRYGKTKEEQQVVTNPNSELKVFTTQLLYSEVPLEVKLMYILF
jgi:hypothetical protein